MRDQIDLLAGYILGNFADEIGKGNPVSGESAVEVAIRLLGRLKTAEERAQELEAQRSATKEALEKLRDLLPQFGGLDGRVWKIIDEALETLKEEEE